jgi:quercetin dioxygenase-like cupin family protein
MTAFAPSLSPSPDHLQRMARDLLGFASRPASPITYHTMLPSILTGEAMSLVESTWPLGTACPCHRHDAENEILIVLSGTLEVRMAGQAMRFGPGQTAFIPRGLDHEVRAYTEARHIAILTRKDLEPIPVAAAA